MDPPPQILTQLDQAQWPCSWQCLYPEDPATRDLLERRLVIELGETHALFPFRHAATCLARREDCDDVLYWIDGAEQPFALIHLTWGPRPEIDPHPKLPWVVFFPTLSDIFASDDFGKA